MKSLVNKILVPFATATLLNLQISCTPPDEGIDKSPNQTTQAAEPIQPIASQSNQYGYSSNRTNDSLKTSSQISITQPKDGGIIRRSRSMLDPIDVCVKIDSSVVNLDSIVKIDYNWLESCTDTSLERNFAIQPSRAVENDSGVACVQWWNTNDLGWIKKKW
ncbi:hypothetical protein HY212_04600 [Candidatus Pacearchaeota archaeon]|nr:hypothetical protein [Candidatus Pacearchaeota archaeon]